MAALIFKGGHYREAYTDFDTLLKASTVPGRENLFWKALTLEKMKQLQEASSLYDQLSHGNDFYALLAIDKYRELNKRDPSELKGNENFQIATLPGPDSLSQVQDLYAKGDVIPALLYLRMYDEAANDLQAVSEETWTLLNVNSKDPSAKIFDSCLHRRPWRKLQYCNLLFRTVRKKRTGSECNLCCTGASQACIISNALLRTGLSLFNSTEFGSVSCAGNYAARK